MEVTVLVGKKIAREDYDISDGRSIYAEYTVRKFEVDRISRDEYIIRFVGKEDETLVSIVVSPDDIYRIIMELAKAWFKGDG